MKEAQTAHFTNEIKPGFVVKCQTRKHENHYINLCQSHRVDPPITYAGSRPMTSCEWMNTTIPMVLDDARKRVDIRSL